MTPEEKVALLKEAGVWDVIGFPGCIDKLIALVAAHEREKWEQALPIAMDAMMLQEREECAKVCDARTGEPGWCCADAIRARGEQ